MYKKIFGQKGEDLASKFLKNEGFRILKRNFRCKIGEMDIIASKNQEIYFIEVKTRSNIEHGSPFESITSRKQRQLINIANYFMMKQKDGLDYHISAIGIEEEKNGQFLIEFIEDITE